MPEQILPFYVVCDQSYSMFDHLDALNDGLAQLHAAVGTDPVVADITRLCLIGFSGSATVLQPLCRPSDVVGLRYLTTQAATSFGEAFRVLRDTIERDVEALKAKAHKVYRPAVFFLSDGHPTDQSTWPDFYARLVDPEWPSRPNIIAFGIGDADAATIGRIGTFQAFMSHGGVSPAAALHSFARALTTSVVRTAADDGEMALRVPARIDGFTTLRIDPL
jgi:uncharacterized protein YegL